MCTGSDNWSTERRIYDTIAEEDAAQVAEQKIVLLAGRITAVKLRYVLQGSVLSEGFAVVSSSLMLQTHLWHPSSDSLIAANRSDDYWERQCEVR